MMVRRVERRSQGELLIHKWWVRGIITLVFLGAAYGLISLAINSGSLLEYAAGLICLWYALHSGIRVFRAG